MKRDEVMYLMERILKDDIERINNGELNDEERKRTVDEVLKLSDKWNEMVKNDIEREKVDKVPGKKFTKTVEGIKAVTGITTTAMNLLMFRSAFNKVGALEETGRWTTTAFRKLPWPKVNK